MSFFFFLLSVFNLYKVSCHWKFYSKKLNIPACSGVNLVVLVLLLCIPDCERMHISLWSAYNSLFLGLNHKVGAIFVCAWGFFSMWRSKTEYAVWMCSLSIVHLGLLIFMRLHIFFIHFWIYCFMKSLLVNWHFLFL